MIPQTLEEFYELYYPKIKHYVKVRVRLNADDIEDMTLDIVYKAWEKRHLCFTPGKFPVWVFVVARNHVYDRFRRMNLVTFMSLDGPGTLSYSGNKVRDIDPSDYYEQADESPSPAEVLELKELKVKVRQAVNKLKPHHKTMVKLRYVEGLSVEEIMAQEDMAEGTIKSQSFRAREK